MVSKAVDSQPLNQCHFVCLRKSGNGGLGCDCFTTVIPDTEMADLTAKKIKNYTHFTLGSLGLHHISDLVNDKKPIIYDYKLSGDESHIVVMDEVERKKMANGKNISWIHIADPWPKDTGNCYFTTYERYYAQPNIKKNNSGKSRKYTISFAKSTNSGLNANDSTYLKNVFFSDNPRNLIQGLLNNIRDSSETFSNSFYNTINFNKSLASVTKISRSYHVVYVRNIGTTGQSDSIKTVLIRTLLNEDPETDINFLVQNNQIKTVITSAKVNNPNNSFSFNNKWIINHIESGKKYQSLLEKAKSAGIDLFAENDSNVIMHYMDTYFAVLKKNNEYHIFDIYGDGFKKTGGDTHEVISTKSMKINDFIQYLKTNR